MMGGGYVPVTGRRAEHSGPVPVSVPVDQQVKIKSRLLSHAITLQTTQ